MAAIPVWCAIALIGTSKVEMQQKKQSKRSVNFGERRGQTVFFVDVAAIINISITKTPSTFICTYIHVDRA